MELKLFGKVYRFEIANTVGGPSQVLDLTDRIRITLDRELRRDTYMVTVAVRAEPKVAMDYQASQTRVRLDNVEDAIVYLLQVQAKEATEAVRRHTVAFDALHEALLMTEEENGN